MSDQSDANDRLKRQRDDLQLLSQVMSHDIRNDLQLVQAYAEMLDDYIEEGGEEYLEIVKQSTRDAVDLTAAARDLSEVLLREHSELQSILIDGVLDQQIDGIRSAHPEAVITVEGTIPKREVRADEMLSSVFRNLLRNAVQHNDKTPPKVAISVEEREDTVDVQIADNGPGVPDRQKAEIFGKGEKGLDSPGAGIGLYLVQSLVESYGGTVTVSDNDPDGATFTVELPRAD